MSRFFKAIEGTATFEEWGAELISAEVVVRKEFADQRKEVTQADAEDIAKAIREAGDWDLDLCEELCDMADMCDEWEEANGDAFEEVVYAAAEKLGVEI